jgi:hypothetical protein
MSSLFLTAASGSTTTILFNKSIKSSSLKITRKYGHICLFIGRSHIKYSGGNQE